MTTGEAAAGVEEAPLAAAVESYLATFTHGEQKETRKQYGIVLRRLAAVLGDRDVAGITTADLTAWMQQTGPEWAPKTWNDTRTTLRSAWKWFGAEGLADPGIPAKIKARTVPDDRNRAIPGDVLTGLLEDRRIPLRERTMWRMMYDTAARESELLRLNVEDLDMAHNRAAVIRKGSGRDTIVWQSGTAMLLPRLLKGRKTGPLFTTAIRTRPGAQADRTARGYGRLSARTAQALFRQHTLDTPGGPYTLHQIRHRAATDASEDGASAVMLMAYGGWSNVKSVARYARPSTEALAEFQAKRDPGRRR